MLLDEGFNFLDDRITELRYITEENMMPKMGDEEDKKTKEEQLVDISLSSKDFHDKARLLILDEISDIMENKDNKKNKNSKVTDKQLNNLTYIGV